MIEVAQFGEVHSNIGVESAVAHQDRAELHGVDRHSELFPAAQDPHSEWVIGLAALLAGLLDIERVGAEPPWQRRNRRLE
ncbi:hypothetical protein GCM10027167_50880 [Nocardia heshunensis]